MGAGASADTRETINNYLLNKPPDASDITELDQARAEIRKLRRFARDFAVAEKKGNADGKKKQRREVVMDRGEQVASSQSYVPKVVAKSDKIKSLLLGVVKSNVLFSSYAQEEQNAIVDAFEAREYPEDTFIIKQGDHGDRFYVVESGELDIFVRSKDGSKDTKITNKELSIGSSFGELALMYGTPRQASIKSKLPCVLWEIDRLTYRGIITYFKFVRNKQYLGFLKNVAIDKYKLGDLMSDSELEKMVISLERETYNAGETIIRQGNKGDHFYIIASGTVQITQLINGDETPIVQLDEGNFFGEKALLAEDVRAASCIASTDVVCLTLGRDDFVDMMGTFEDLMNKDNNKKSTSTQLESDSVAKSTPFALSLEIGDLSVTGTLGCGAFGRVKLAYYAPKDTFFALKCQAKRSIVDSGLQEHVLNEMRVMKKIQHPCITKLYSALQDKEYIYFVLELMLGGELFTYLRSKGQLVENSAKFYAAIVVYAFTTLHAKKIAYRDLKPENLVMDTKGYIKLVDFGLAKQLIHGKTWTLCGTPDYLAPEIILNEGHDLAVDYWALGVLIYEIVNGTPPFYADDPMETYEKILTNQPPPLVKASKNLQDLLKRLLRSQQGKRLGNTRGGTAALVKHKWFSSYDWASLEAGKTQAPYTPVVTSPSDLSNFDKFDDCDAPGNSDWNPDLSE